MAYFCSSMMGRLREAFTENRLVLKSDYIVVEGSENYSKEKIQRIIESKGLYPLVSEGKIEGNFIFTVAPYKLPDFFIMFDGGHLLVQKPLSHQVNLSYKTVNEFTVELFLNNAAGYSAHFEHNKNNILLAAKDLSGEALILGLGNGHDIPLEELAHQFDQITVLDIDIEAMRKAIHALPEHLQNKIMPVRKDLTGIVTAISEKLEKLNCSEIEVLEVTADIINESASQHKPELFSSQKKYQLVVSSMLTSQLFSQMHAYVMDVLEKKYPDIKNKQSLKLSIAIENLMKQVCLAHMDHLAVWTHANGRIYYADTTHLHIVEPDFANKDSPLRITQTLEALPNAEIEEKIKSIFSSVREDECWQWETVPPQLSLASVSACTRPGNVMRVVGRFLQPV